MSEGSTMTPLQQFIDESEKVCDAATPNWYADCDLRKDGAHQICRVAPPDHPAKSLTVCFMATPKEDTEADMVFIAHARTALPVALQHLRDLSARVAELEQRLNRTDSYPCRRCGFRSGLDAMVSDDVWAMIGGKTFDKLCLWCIDDLCNEVGIKNEAVVLYFGGGKSLHTITNVVEESAARFDAMVSCANALQQKAVTMQLELDAMRARVVEQEPKP